MAAKAYSYARFSTPEQIKGDSLRRQLEMSRRYASEHALDLADEDELRDIGVSAFRGANAAEGALSQFLEAVRSKRVPVGSYLLIESLDRLSRQQVFAAFTTFSEIISAGVKIITLTNQKVYDSTIDLSGMLMSIVDMERAHEESRLKSTRVRAAWSTKWKNAGTRIVSQKCPSWLRPKGDLSGFDVVESRAKVVNRIYELAASGMGASGIVIQLNRQKVSTFRGRGDWGESFVKSILRSRTVIGELQPRSLVDGKRVADGNPLAGYYPQIVQTELWYAVQQALDGRRSDRGGRKGDNVGNVFSKMIRCGRCGSALHVVNRGLRGGKALQCSKARVGVGQCTRKVWKYPEFERTFLQFVKECPLDELSADAGARRELDEIDRTVQAAEGRLQEARRNRERVFNLLLAAEDDFLATKLREMTASVADMEKQVATLRESRDRMAREGDAFSASQAEIVSLIDRVQADDDDTYALRSSLAARLRDLIKEIRVWNWGELTNSKGFAPPDSRFIEIRFRDATTRLVACSASGMTWTRSKSPERSDERPEKGLTGEFVGD